VLDCSWAVMLHWLNCFQIHVSGKQTVKALLIMYKRHDKSSWARDLQIAKKMGQPMCGEWRHKCWFLEIQEKCIFSPACTVKWIARPKIYSLNVTITISIFVDMRGMMASNYISWEKWKLPWSPYCGLLEYDTNILKEPFAPCSS
jgi:hypothetical protein